MCTMVTLIQLGINRVTLFVGTEHFVTLFSGTEQFYIADIQIHLYT